MKKVIGILVVVLGLVCVAQADADWTLYDSFGGGDRWALAKGEVWPAVVSSGELKFETENSGGYEDSYVAVTRTDVRGIRADLKVDSSSTTYDGGIELIVSAENPDEMHTYFELTYSANPSDSWAEINALVSQGGDDVWEHEGPSFNLDQVYELSIEVGDDNRFRYYKGGVLFATSPVYSQLVSKVKYYLVGSWNDEPGRVKAYADDVSILVASGVMYDLSGQWEWLLRGERQPITLVQDGSGFDGSARETGVPVSEQTTHVVSGSIVGTTVTYHNQYSDDDGWSGYHDFSGVYDPVSDTIRGTVEGSDPQVGDYNYDILWTRLAASEEPDLIITATTPTSKTVKAGGPVSITVTTENDGDASATSEYDPEFDTALLLSTSTNFLSMSEQDMEYATVAEHEFWSGLAAGASASSNLTFTAPSKAGTYYLRAKADDWDAIDESNESNNWGPLVTLTVEYIPVSITQPSDGGEITQNPETVRFGDDVTFTATVPPGYKVKHWVVNGGDPVGEGKESYTVSGITSATTVSVVFERNAAMPWLNLLLE